MVENLFPGTESKSVWSMIPSEMPKFAKMPFLWVKHDGVPSGALLADKR